MVKSKVVGISGGFTTQEKNYRKEGSIKTKNLRPLYKVHES